MRNTLTVFLSLMKHGFLPDFHCSLFGKRKEWRPGRTPSSVDLCLEPIINVAHVIYLTVFAGSYQEGCENWRVIE